MAHILPDSGPHAWCEHGTPLGHTCQWCITTAPAVAPAVAPQAVPPSPVGWSCPRCGHSYAPWVPECHHCPQPGPIGALTDRMLEL